MMPLQDSLQKQKAEYLQAQLKHKQAQMLAFLFNAQFQIALERFDEKYAPYSQLKKQQGHQKIKNQELRRIFNTLSQKLHQRIIREDVECDKALNKLQTLWQTRKIQLFHRYYFQKYVYSTFVKNAHILIKNQDFLIRQQQHIYFTILRAIWAREACLNHIGRQLIELNPEDMHEHYHTVREREVDKNRKEQQKQYRVHGYRVKYRLDKKDQNLTKTKMQYLSEDINNYRKLTVHVVQLITKWKTYMQSLTHDIKKRRQKISYYYMENNYLLNILNDSSFIASSFLTNFYSFAIRNDTFLLRPIFAIQKKQSDTVQLSFQDHQLKSLITCTTQQLHSIMEAVGELYGQLESNLRNRRVVDYKILARAKSLSNNQFQTASSLKLSPLKLTKLTHIQSYKTQNNSQSNVLFRQNSSSLTKSNVLIRKQKSKANSPKTTNSNFMKNSNPQLTEINKMMDFQTLKKLKEDVFNKVKLDLQLQTKKKLLQSREFADLVDDHVRESMNQIVEQNRLKMLQTVWQVTALSYFQQQLSSYISSIFKMIPTHFYPLQPNQQSIIKLVNQIEYCYFLKIHTANEQIAHIIATINRQISQYKSIEVKLVTFKDGNLLEQIMIKLVEFIWKYQNAKEVIFCFNYNNQEMQAFMKLLAVKVGENCRVIAKKYKKYTENKFIFTKKGINQNYVYNPYPQKLHFKLYAALSIQIVKLQNHFETNQISQIHYDYLIMEILRKYTSSQDFVVLRDIFKSKQRLRYLLTQLMELQNNKNRQIQVNSVSAQNVTELNTQLHNQKYPCLEISDLVKINNIQLIQLQQTITISYQLKVVATCEGQKYHRYAVFDEVQYYKDNQSVQFYKLPVVESHHIQVILFKADKFIENNNIPLNMYLLRKLSQIKGKWSKKYIEHLWVQMLRYPQDINSRQQHFIPTFRVNQFNCINKDLVIGDTLDWFTDIQIQNGLQFRKLNTDIYLNKSIGVGVVSKQDWVYYCRVVK